MPDAMGRTTENELAETVLSILIATSSGIALFSDLIATIPTVISLTSPDLQPSDKRPNEALWEQRVRNIKSHKHNEGNYINAGYLAEVDGGLAITEAGRRYKGKI